MASLLRAHLRPYIARDRRQLGASPTGTVELTEAPPPRRDDADYDGIEWRRKITILHDQRNGRQGLLKDLAL